MFLLNVYIMGIGRELKKTIEHCFISHSHFNLNISINSSKHITDSFTVEYKYDDVTHKANVNTFMVTSFIK